MSQQSAGSAEFLDQLLSRATASGGSGAEVAQALDVPIALLERRAALEAARQHYPSEAGPTDADARVEEQVGDLPSSPHGSAALPSRSKTQTSWWHLVASGGSTASSEGYRRSGHELCCWCEAEEPSLCRVQTAAAVASHAAALAAMLEPADSSAVQLTPFGCLAPPLGLARVKASSGGPSDDPSA